MNRVKLLIAAVVLTTVGSGLGKVQAGMIIKSPTQDVTYESNGSFAANGLTDGYLRVFGRSFVYRAILEFDLLGVENTVNQAEFFIFSNGTNSPGTTLQLHGYSGNGTMEFADAQTDNLLHEFDLGPSQSGYTFDVSSFVQGLVNSSATHAGLMLRVKDEFGTGPLLGADFTSKEAGFGGLPPKLTIDSVNVTAPSTVPEPTSLAIFGVLGLSSLGMRRRRSKRVA